MTVKMTVINTGQEVSLFLFHAVFPLLRAYFLNCCCSFNSVQWAMQTRLLSACDVKYPMCRGFINRTLQGQDVVIFTLVVESA